MRIETKGPVGTSGTRGKPASSSSGAVFRPDTGTTTPRAAQAGGAMATTGIDALLALQAVDDPVTGRRKAIKRANALLDSLEEMRDDVLTGRLSEGRLNRAVALLQQAKDQTEPGLDEIVADIELRVRVELAKLGKFPAL
jgi:hypothetical protein